MATVCGTVKFFSAKRGYGFIIPDDPEQDGQEYFVHHTSILGDGFRSLATGEEVQFEVNRDATTQKLVAINVTGPDGAPVKGDSKPQGKGFGKGKGKDSGKGAGKDFAGGKGGGGKPALKGKAAVGYGKGGGWADSYDAPKGGKYGGYRDFKGKGYGKGYDDYDYYGGYGGGYDDWGYKGDKGYGKGYADDYGYGSKGKFAGKGSFKGGYKGDYYDDYDYVEDYKGYKGPPIGSKGAYKGPPPSKGKDSFKGGFSGSGKGDFGGDKGGFKGGGGARKGKYDDFY